MRMVYEIKLSAKVQKQLKKLKTETQEHILAVLDRCRIRPHHHAKKLSGNNFFALRAGEYRIIVDINNKDLLIIAIEIGKRENVYK